MALYESVWYLDHEGQEKHKRFGQVVLPKSRALKVTMGRGPYLELSDFNDDSLGTVPLMSYGDLITNHNYEQSITEINPFHRPKVLQISCHELFSYGEFLSVLFELPGNCQLGWKLIQVDTLRGFDLRVINVPSANLHYYSIDAEGDGLSLSLCDPKHINYITALPLAHDLLQFDLVYYQLQFDIPLGSMDSHQFTTRSMQVTTVDVPGSTQTTTLKLLECYIETSTQYNENDSDTTLYRIRYNVHFNQCLTNASARQMAAYYANNTDVISEESRVARSWLHASISNKLVSMGTSDCCHCMLPWPDKWFNEGSALPSDCCVTVPGESQRDLTVMSDPHDIALENYSMASKIGSRYSLVYQRITPHTTLKTFVDTKNAPPVSDGINLVVARLDHELHTAQLISPFLSQPIPLRDRSELEYHSMVLSKRGTQFISITRRWSSSSLLNELHVVPCRAGNDEPADSDVAEDLIQACTVHLNGALPQGESMARPAACWNKDQLYILYLDVLALGNLVIELIVLVQTNGHLELKSQSFRVLGDHHCPVPQCLIPSVSDHFGALEIIDAPKQELGEDGEERTVLNVDLRNDLLRTKLISWEIVLYSSHDLAAFAERRIVGYLGSQGEVQPLPTGFYSITSQIISLGQPKKLETLPNTALGMELVSVDRWVSATRGTVACTGVAVKLHLNELISHFKPRLIDWWDQHLYDMSTLETMRRTLGHVLHFSLFGNLDIIRPVLRTVFAASSLPIITIDDQFEESSMAKGLRVLDTDSVLMQLLIHLPRAITEGQQLTCWPASSLGLLKKMLLYEHLGLVRASLFRKSLQRLSAEFKLDIPSEVVPKFDRDAVLNCCIASSLILLLSEECYVKSIISRVIRDIQYPSLIAYSALVLIMGFYCSDQHCDGVTWIAESNKLGCMVVNQYASLLDRGDIEATNATMDEICLLVGLCISVFFVSRGPSNISIPLNISNGDQVHQVWVTGRSAMSSVISLSVLKILTHGTPEIGPPKTVPHKTIFSDSNIEISPLPLYWLLGYVEPKSYPGGLLHSNDSIRSRRGSVRADGASISELGQTAIITKRPSLTFVNLALSQQKELLDNDLSSRAFLLTPFRAPCVVYQLAEDIDRVANIDEGLNKRLSSSIPLAAFIPLEYVISQRAQERILTTHAAIKPTHHHPQALSGELSLFKPLQWSDTELYHIEASQFSACHMDRINARAMRDGVVIRIMSLLFLHHGLNPLDRCMALRDVICVLGETNQDILWAVIASTYSARLTVCEGVPTVLLWRKMLFIFIDYLVGNYQSVGRAMLHRFCTLILKALDPRDSIQRLYLYPTVQHLIYSIIRNYNTVAHSEVKQTLVYGGSDGAIIIYDYKTCSQTRLNEGHRGPVACANFAPDGMRFATYCMEDRTLSLWQLSKSGMWGTVTGTGRTASLTQSTKLEKLPSSVIGEVQNTRLVFTQSGTDGGNSHPQTKHFEATSKANESSKGSQEGYWLLRREDGDWYTHGNGT